MSTIDVKEFFRTWKEKGISTAFYLVFSGILIAVIDNFTARIIPTIVDSIDNYFSPPNVILKLSNAIDIKNGEIKLRGLATDPSTAKKVVYQTESPRLISVQTAPGSYIIEIFRTKGDLRDKLVDSISFKTKGESVPIDTSEILWEKIKIIGQYDGYSFAGDLSYGYSDLSPTANLPPTLVGTRWITTPVDFELISTIEDRSARSALAIALAEVGTFKRGGNSDELRIAEYWKAVPNFRFGDKTPWGGAFLSWVIEKSNAIPLASASFTDWTNWGQKIPAESDTRGMIAIFPLPDLPQAPSKLLVGLILKIRAECVEIITGNIAERVAITCVKLPLNEIRWAKR